MHANAHGCTDADACRRGHKPMQWANAHRCMQTQADTCRHKCKMHPDGRFFKASGCTIVITDHQQFDEEDELYEEVENLLRQHTVFMLIQFNGSPVH